jgi:glycosyltransferase involved in cell wall biosynthesis
MAPISRFYWQRWLPACVRNSDIIIADSDNTKQDIIKFLKVAPEKIKVVYLAASENFKPLPKTDSQKSQLKRYGIARRYILNVGTIEPRKNIPLLIEAFGGYIKESKQNSLLLVIAGKKGWDYQRCLQKVKEVGLEDNVIFCNYVADNDLPLLYNFAEVFICPSFYEGFGLPVLEAMCCGAPVICSNRSSLPEVAADAACYIEPDSIDSIKSAIKRLMEDNTLREDLSKKALERSKKFSWTETANKTLDIYREILN